MNKIKLVKAVALPLLVGAVSGSLTGGGMQSFGMLNKPPLSPPGWLFPVVWTILYILMGIASYLVAEADADEEKKEKALSIYYYQLLVNFLWPVFFFSFGWYLFAFLWLIFLWILIILMIKSFYDISRLAAYLCIPYLIWVTFAGYLNFGIWWLNR